MSVKDLPALNASLDAAAALLLIAGWIFARRGDVRRHRACMTMALAASAAFLTSYVIYHSHTGSRPFTRIGPIRPIYFTLLFTHVVLAAAIVPLVLMTVTHALRGRVERHRALARWTLPLWLYVSVTGVVVYWMLYRL